MATAHGGWRDAMCRSRSASAVAAAILQLSMLSIIAIPYELLGTVSRI
jgi:hypothetical protein